MPLPRAGAMALGDNAVLGIAMGSSLAAGYVTPEGGITPWLNELAFAPVDYHPGAPIDEWSGDAGCGVQYLSQQAVGLLIPKSGIALDPAIPLPEAVVLPGMIAPLHLETWAYVRAVEVAMLADRRIFLVPRRSHEEGTSPESLGRIGVIATVEESRPSRAPPRS